MEFSFFIAQFQVNISLFLSPLTHSKMFYLLNHVITFDAYRLVNTSELNGATMPLSSPFLTSAEAPAVLRDVRRGFPHFLNENGWKISLIRSTLPPFTSSAIQYSQSSGHSKQKKHNYWQHR
jgi:hypothetical protein